MLFDSELVKLEVNCLSNHNEKSKCGDIYVHTNGIISLGCGFCDAMEFFTVVEYTDHYFKCHHRYQDGLQCSVTKIERFANADADSHEPPPDNVIVSQCTTTTEATQEDPLLRASLEVRKDTSVVVLNSASKRPNRSVADKGTSRVNTKCWLQMPPFAGLPVYTCGYCSAEVDSRRKLLQHMFGVHSYGSACRLCGKQLSALSSRLKHERRHLRDRCVCCKPKCLKCQLQIELFKMSTATEPDYAMTTVTGHKKSWRQMPPFGSLSSYTCDYCSVELTSRDKLMQHMHKVHSIGYGCTFCGKQLSRRTSRRNHELIHIRLKHCSCQRSECLKCQNRSNFPQIRQIQKCESCDLVFRRQADLQHHMWTLHSIGFPCRFCGRHFMLHHNRNTHELTHTSERPYQCQYCSRTFQLKTSLKDHTKLHTGERPFLCTVCGKGFVSNAKMNAHTARLHTSERIRCKCTVCGETFKHRESLNRHQKTVHSQVKTTCTCDICQRSFANRKCMVQHMKIHTGTKPYKCRYCGMSFAQAAGKRGHERNKHEDVVV